VECRDAAPMVVTDSSVVVVTGPEEGASRRLAQALVRDHLISRVCLMSAADYATILPPLHAPSSPPPPPATPAPAARPAVGACRGPRMQSRHALAREESAAAREDSAGQAAHGAASFAREGAAARQAAAVRHDSAPLLLALGSLGSRGVEPAALPHSPLPAAAAAAQAPPRPAEPAGAAPARADALPRKAAGSAAAVAGPAGAARWGKLPEVVEEQGLQDKQEDKHKDGGGGRWGLVSLAAVGKRLLDALPDD
jgi:hypothetical protein